MGRGLTDGFAVLAGYHGDLGREGFEDLLVATGVVPVVVGVHYCGKVEGLGFGFEDGENSVRRGVSSVWLEGRVRAAKRSAWTYSGGFAGSMMTASLVSSSLTR